MSAEKYKPPKYRTIDGEKWLITAASRRGLPGPKRFGTADLAVHKEYIKGLGYNVRCYRGPDKYYRCWAKKK